MKFFNFLTAAALATTSVIAHPFHQQGESLEHLEKRQNQAVVNLDPQGSQVFPRLEVRQLKDTKPNQWTLLVLALREYYRRKDQTGYFAIAGIHGVPRINYNNVGICDSCRGADGYCTHDSVHFPAWHRAYMALFEQELLKIAKTIANTFPAAQRQTMVNAANELRYPFFDWAARPPAGRPTLPAIITDVDVSVTGPDGRRQTFTNPFFRYDFTGAERGSMVYSPFTTWTRSYRYPNNNGAGAASDTGRAISAFANTRQSLQDQIYQILTQCNNYLAFSTDDAGSSNARCSNNIESIHNTVHSIAGGGGSSSVSGGHMFYLPTASYDPIFWLHHCNVDRIFALWQAINPNAYGASQRAPHNTWTIAQGSDQNINSPLTPFTRRGGGFWTTNQVRNTRTLLYTYPEFSSSDGSANAIRNYVNQYYGPNPQRTAGSVGRRDAEPQISDVLNEVANEVAGTVHDVLANNPLVAANGSDYQYAANIQTPRYTLNGSYTVMLFNGKPASEDPTTWITDKNLIGPFGVMSQPNKQDHDILVTGSIPLTRTLRAMVESGNGILASLTEALVAPYLTKNLEWRIEQEGQSIDPGTVDGFLVSVVTSTAKVSEDKNVFPVFSEFIPLVDVTKGQSGGANDTAASISTAVKEALAY